MSRRLVIGLALGVCVAGTAMLGAQSVNVDFGNGAATPPSSYGGVGVPGVWNGIPGTQFTSYSGFVDVDGHPTSVTMTNVGGSQLLSEATSLPSSENSLLGDYLVTYTPTLETCLFFHGLQNGTYRVTTYAWHPSNPAISSFVTCDQTTTGGVTVGGSWSGSLELGVHFAQHVAVVTTGDLYLHSGIPSGASINVAVLNGVQLQLLPEPGPDFIRGDANHDGGVDLGDAVASLDVLFASQPDTCANALDANDDGQHDIADAIAVLAYLFASGSPPPAPFPSCGNETTVDQGCESFTACP